MASRTIKVTGIPEELLQRLDRHIQTLPVTGRSEYIRELIHRDVLESRATPPGWPSPELPFSELLAPLQEEAVVRGESEDETEEILCRELAAHRHERRI